jgi:DNA-binding response OmpR family regulator
MANILAIDDEEDIRLLLKNGLSLAGHNVTTASDGREGKRRCDAELPDLVITDLVMPNQEGIETIVMLLREFPSLPIVAISGSGHGGDWLMIAKRLGVRATLAKPFSIDELLMTVRAILSRAEATG